MREVAIGARFGTREITAVVGLRASYRCDCGHEASAAIEHLLRYPEGTCRRCASKKSARVTHGHTRRRDDGGNRRTPEYVAWESMLQRCRDKNCENYKRYGACGITVCDEWVGDGGFERFLAHIGPRPSSDHSVDRYPSNEGNYEPGNVRWATRVEQHRNKSSNKLLSFSGETLCVAEWAERLGCAPSAIHDRLDDGWSVEDAVTKPVKKYRPRAA